MKGYHQIATQTDINKSRKQKLYAHSSQYLKFYLSVQS